MTETQAAFREWSPPVGPLGELLAEAARRAARLESTARELARAAEAVAAPPSFAAALRRADVAVIAEVKRRSPSLGALNEGLDAGLHARVLAGGGASALSVLTEPTRFAGSLDDLRAAGAAGLPMLRKDFIVSAAQLAEARAAGASAVLLIARALPPVQLSALARAARALGLEVLLEVRTEAELEHALRVDGAVIGVNSRNLETLVIEPDVSERLLPGIPPDRIAVYESGIRTRDDAERAAALGADAVLVGSALSSSADPRAAVANLTGIGRRSRGR